MASDFLVYMVSLLFLHHRLIFARALFNVSITTSTLSATTVNNRRKNELRYFALNGLFDVFRTSKREKIAFPPLSPPCNVVQLFELPLENKKHPNFEWRGQGSGVDSYVSEVTLQCLHNFVADWRLYRLHTWPVHVQYNYIREIIDVKGEESWPKQGTLWHSPTDILSLWGTTVYNGKLLSVL